MQPAPLTQWLTGGGEVSILPPNDMGGFFMVDWRESCHPDIREMLAYWESKCRGRPMPARDDIDPAEITRFLPQLILVDVVDDDRRYVYRLIGTREVDLRGSDPTGKPVLDHFVGASAEAAIENYESVRLNCAPLYAIDPFHSAERYFSDENLFLPLSNDGRTVNMIMVYATVRDLYKAPPYGPLIS